MCRIFFVSSIERQAQSLVVDLGSASFRASIPMFQNASLFSQRNDLSFSLSLILSLTQSLSSFLRYLACHQNRRNSRSKVHPRTVSREHLSLPFLLASLFSLERESEVERGLEIYAPRISLLVCPSVLRKSKIARAYGTDRDISIRYLDSLLQPSERQLFFPGIYPSLR